MKDQIAEINAEQREFHKKCHDCGVFLKRELWVPKDHAWKKHALCYGCMQNYDDPRTA